MIVGVLKEIKVKENRVAMTPAGVATMNHNGHRVWVEKGAGLKSGPSGRKTPRDRMSLVSRDGIDLLLEFHEEVRSHLADLREPFSQV